MEEALFCVYRKEKRDGKLTKILYDSATGKRGRSNDYKTFCNFYNAHEVYERGCIFADTGMYPEYDGLGFGVFIDIKNNYSFIDIDHCRNTKTGEISKDALEVIQLINSYTEISCSGDGIHIIFKTNLGLEREDYKSRYYFNNPYNPYECYISGLTNKFGTLTGNVFQDYTEIRTVDTELQKFLDEKMVRETSNKDQSKTVTNNTSISNLSENSTADEIIHELENMNDKFGFFDLFHGNTSNYLNENGEIDDSRADQALFNRIVWRVGDNYQLVKEIAFKSALVRDKWNREDYLRMTFESALNYNSSKGFYDKDFYKKSELKENADKGISDNSEIVFPEPKSAKEFYDEEIPKTNWILKDILPDNGFIMLAAEPKDGKSMFCSQLIASLTQGLEMFGEKLEKVNPNTIMYFDLENPSTVKQDRLHKFFPTKDFNDFQYVDKAYKILDDTVTFTDQMDYYLKSYPDIKIVVIDMYKHLQVDKKSNATQNNHEARELKILSDYFHKNNILGILVNHVTKADAEDPFNKLLGSTSAIGAFDHLIVLTKEIDKTTKATKRRQLHTRGRFNAEQHFEMTFNSETCMWDKVCSSDDFAQVQAELEFNKSPIVQAIQRLLDKSPTGVWQGPSKKIRDEIAEIKKIDIEATPTSQTINKEIEAYKDFFIDLLSIGHETIKHSGSAIIHKFYKL